MFRFLRACDYGLPQLFSVVELFAKRLDPSTNYSLFVAEMPRWFRAEVLKYLDEQGVPAQISERFLRPGDTIESLRARLLDVAQSEAQNEHSQLTAFERRWVIDALEPIREVWIHDEGLAARRLSMMRIMASRTKAATVVA